MHIYNKRKGKIAVIRLHGNENTCVRAFFALPRKNNFVLYKLAQYGKRLLAFKIGKRIYSFDPNRMFSKRGISKTLKRYNGRYPHNLVNKILVFSRKILAIAGIEDSKKVIIAIHNNTNGKISARTFNHYSRASKIFIVKSIDPDDFFIVTRKAEFNFFKKHRQNVVLQSKFAEDDGSLSIYCQKRHIPYVNVEAQYGHLTQQKHMLLLCEKLLTIH
jgi:hypothetical protein